MNNDELLEFPMTLPLLVQDELFIYPFMILPIFVSDEENIRAIDKAMESKDMEQKRIFVSVAKDDGGC